MFAGAYETPSSLNESFYNVLSRYVYNHSLLFLLKLKWPNNKSVRFGIQLVLVAFSPFSFGIFQYFLNSWFNASS